MLLHRSGGHRAAFALLQQTLELHAARPSRDTGTATTMTHTPSTFAHVYLRNDQTFAVYLRTIICRCAPPYISSLHVILSDTGNRCHNGARTTIKPSRALGIPQASVCNEIITRVLTMPDMLPAIAHVLPQLNAVGRTLPVATYTAVMEGLLQHQQVG